MSPTVEIDEEVFDYIKNHAEPLVDTANTVLRRLLGFDSNGYEGRVPSAGHSLGPSAESRIRPVQLPADGRAARGSILPESAYWLPTLRYLVGAGGSASSRTIIDAVGKELDAQGLLTETDKEPLGSGEIRWRSRAAFARLHLGRQGYLDENSPHGIWRITDTGRRYLEEHA